MRTWDCYLAAPLFSEAEQEYNKHIADSIEAATRRRVFLPQRDGGLVNEGDSPEACFAADIAAMRKCLFAVAILDGMAVDSGVAWECGYLYQLNIPIFGLVTDPRANPKTALMVQKSLRHVYRDVPLLLTALSRAFAPAMPTLHTGGLYGPEN